MLPADVQVDDGGLLRRGVLYAAVGVAYVLAATSSALVLTDATIRELVPFAAVVVGGCACWLLGHALAGLRRQRRVHQAVEAFFDGPVWEHWTYSADEWRTIVDRDHPDDPPLDEWNWSDHLVTFGGLGFVFAMVVGFAGVFGIDDPDATPVVVVIAAWLFVVMLVAALLQPFYLRRLHHERRAALLAVTDPGAWFGPHAIYHHELGFVPLEPLTGVHDDTTHRHARPEIRARRSERGVGSAVVRGDGSVVFTIGRPPGRRQRLDDVPALPARVVHVDVPSAARDRAQELVVRYHRGRPDLAE